jgi:lipopolysaccharide/colanic/teichoic acid biosynthesis glycosyltransferase
LIIFLPVILVIAILIKIDSKGPVIFFQDREGEKKKTYRIHKFRSMVEDAENSSGPVWTQDDDARVTRVGKIIRKFRLDELPQLWNVLKGEMSFVGPRPERPVFVKELEKIIPYFGVRSSVKPGITGWAQICYGYANTVQDAIEKLNYDLFYIKNMSILMDLMIVLRTIKIVIYARGAR